MTNREVVPCDPVRTNIGTCNGNLKDVPAPALDAMARMAIEMLPGTPAHVH